MNLIILPYLDCPAYTEAAIQDCVAQSIGAVTLLLIDNGSQDAGRLVGETAARTHPRVYRWWHNPPAPSLAGIWNRALQFAWESGVQQVLVVNNDVRLHPDTYAVLSEARMNTGAWFISGVGVLEGQFDPTINLRDALGTVTEARKDGVRPEGYSYGGPDFSCFLITRECHRWFQFDEGFVPAYFEDNDFHRRLQLAGFGDKIFGVNVPFLHYGSGTLKGNARLREGWPPRFAACQQYYVEKWGGLPGSETFQYPFNALTLDEAASEDGDPRRFYTGQGKPGYTLGAATDPSWIDLFNGQTTREP